MVIMEISNNLNIISPKGVRYCNCKYSKCLKLYCECFSSGDYCIDCNCVNCLNKLEFEVKFKIGFKAK